MASSHTTGISDATSVASKTNTKLSFFIFGHNIQHSLSPALHNAGFEVYNLPHHYAIHESPSVDSTVAEIIDRPDFGGASVTFPHKLQVGRLLDTLSDSAEKVGAVNTIVVKQGKDGRRLLFGDNTDWMGIQRCIQKSGMTGLQEYPALVLGAGGAARAACYALQETGIHDVVVVNRTQKSAEAMAAHFPALSTTIVETMAQAKNAGKREFRTIIACVPADDILEEDIPTELFSRAEHGVLVEMAYRPQVTSMMKKAGNYGGWEIYRGIDVLAEQAYSQFEIWVGKPAPVDVMKKAMLAKAS